MFKKNVIGTNAGMASFTGKMCRMRKTIAGSEFKYYGTDNMRCAEFICMIRNRNVTRRQHSMKSSKTYSFFIAVYYLFFRRGGNRMVRMVWWNNSILRLTPKCNPVLFEVKSGDGAKAIASN